MAPLALIQIAEDLSYSSTNVLSAEECQTRAMAASGGAFCIGASAGVALQVQYQRYLPKSIKAMLILPTGLGAWAATAMYRHSVDRYARQWNATPQFTTHTE